MMAKNMSLFTGATGEEEFHLIKQTANPPTPKETSFVWILSSRHDVNGEHINCAKKSKNFTPGPTTANAQDTEICDVDDDFERIKAALEVGQTVTAALAQKSITALSPSDYEKYAPAIIYNGWPEQNASLRSVLEENELSLLKKIPYPRSKFLIFDMPEQQQHTGGQFTSLAKLAETDPRLQKLKGDNCHVTIVTSAYHIPRVRRLFNSKEFKNPFSLETKITLHGVDRTYDRPCAFRDLQGELTRLKKYAEIGHIGAPAASNWYDVKSLQAWTPLRLVKAEPMIPFVVDSLISNAVSRKRKTV